MSNTFIITSNDKATVAKLKRIKAGLTPNKIDPVVAKVAFVVNRLLVIRTPKRWTGQTRRSWQVNRLSLGNYQITNISKVMLYLELGTRDHGPKRAKLLFIPLTRKAALAGARNVLQNSGSGGSFKAGKHFVMAKRVRGIRAIRIVSLNRSFAQSTLENSMRMYVRKLISGK